jgi:ribosomal protein L37AE/L43A
VSLDKLRRELAKLKEGHGSSDDCPGCGYQSYKGPFDVHMNVRRTKGAGDTKHEASRCEVCGREKLTIRLRGLEDNPR